MSRFDPEAAEAWDEIAGGKDSRGAARTKPPGKARTGSERRQADDRAGQTMREEGKPSRPSSRGGLYQHGLYTVRATMQLHACMHVGYLYAFSVQEMIRALQEWELDRRDTRRWRRRRYGQRPPVVRQMKVKVPIDGKDTLTAKGLLVPVNRIPMLQEWEIPKAWLMAHEELPEDTSERGALAVEAVKQVFADSSIREMPQGSADQLSGIDLYLDSIACEVKLDNMGGREELGGTGNLFIQTHEANPEGKH